MADKVSFRQRCRGVHMCHSSTLPFCHTTVKTYAGPEVVIARGAAVEGCLDVVGALY